MSRDFSPLIKHINQSCSKEFKEYNQCMIDNPHDVTTCLNVLHTFNACAGKASENFKKQVIDKQR